MIKFKCSDIPSNDDFIVNDDGLFAFKNNNEVRLIHSKTLSKERVNFYVFLLDVSGSMSMNRRLNNAVESLRFIINYLAIGKDDDKLDCLIIPFSSKVYDEVKGTKNQILNGLSIILETGPQESTNLNLGLEAFDKFRLKNLDKYFKVCVITDGASDDVRRTIEEHRLSKVVN